MTELSELLQYYGLMAVWFAFALCLPPWQKEAGLGSEGSVGWPEGNPFNLVKLLDYQGTVANQI